MQGPGSVSTVTGQIDPTENVAAHDDAYTAGRCLLPRTCSLQLSKGVHRCHAKHVALALKLLPTFYDLKKSNECCTFLLHSRKFSSAKSFVISDRQAVRQEFSSAGIHFRQVPVFARFLFDRSVVALLLIVYLPIHESISYSTLVVIEKIVRNLV